MMEALVATSVPIAVAVAWLAVRFIRRTRREQAMQRRMAIMARRCGEDLVTRQERLQDHPQYIRERRPC